MTFTRCTLLCLNFVDVWEYDDYSGSINRKRNFSKYSSVHGDYSDTSKSYSMPNTPNVAGAYIPEATKRFKYEIKQDMSEVDLETTVSYPKYKRYDEFKCWVNKLKMFYFRISCLRIMNTKKYSVVNDRLRWSIIRSLDSNLAITRYNCLILFSR